MTLSDLGEPAGNKDEIRGRAAMKMGTMKMGTGQFPAC
jgi:hypothetical protein